MSSLGNFSFQFRKAKCWGFFLSSLVAVLADELKNFCTLLTAEEGKKTLCPRGLPK